MFALVPALLAAASTLARERPATPSDVKAIAPNATYVGVSWTNNAPRDVLIQYELEQMTNGVRLSRAAESNLSAGISRSGTGSAWSMSGSTRFRDMTPETEYCFRVWARVVDTGVRSGGPSAWGCVKTPPHPPAAPLDVKAQFASAIHNKPRVSWSTPDQTGWRRIDRYVVERQTSPVPGRPWIVETTLAGPRGAQTASTRLAFATTTSDLDPKLKHLFRVCAENDGGRTCAPVVAVDRAGPAQASTTSQAPRATAGTVPPPPAATSKSLDGARTANPGATVTRPAGQATRGAFDRRSAP